MCDGWKRTVSFQFFFFRCVGTITCRATLNYAPPTRSANNHGVRIFLSKFLRILTHFLLTLNMRPTWRCGSCTQYNDSACPRVQGDPKTLARFCTPYINMSNSDQFSDFFSCPNREKVVMILSRKIPPHLKYLMKLQGVQKCVDFCWPPCIRTSERARRTTTIAWARTCSWRHHGRNVFSCVVVSIRRCVA